MQKFQVLYIDPPWPYNQRSVHNKTKYGVGAGGYYPVMQIPDLRALGPLINARSADNAVMFVWGTNPHLPNVIPFIEACGFEYKTKAFAWVKRNKDGSPFVGPGYYNGSNTEDCWLAVKRKGLGPPDAKMTGQVIDSLNEYNAAYGDTIESTKGKHSAKPEEAYARIERMYPSFTKAEIFARQRRPGWASFGNEIDGQDIRVALSEGLPLDQVPDDLLHRWVELQQSGISTWDLHNLLLNTKG